MSEGSTAPVAAKNNTGTIALVVAGILLFVVCAMLYKDVVDSKLEKERASWGDRPQQPYAQNQQNGYAQQGQQGQQFAPQNPNGQFTQGQQQPYQNPNQQQPYQNQGNQNYQPPVVKNSQNPAAAPATVTPPPVDVFTGGTTPAAPAPPSPELERRKRELEQRRQEQMIAHQQIAALRNGGSTPITSSETGITPPPSFPLASNPGSAVVSAGGRPGTIVPSGSEATGGVAYGEELLKSIDPTTMSPEKYLEYKTKVAADAAKIRKEIQKQDAAIARVQNSPAIAQVKLYDSQWNFVEINGGKDRNLQMKQRLTIRRGTKILGVIEITELGDDYAVGELKTANSRRDDKLKPQAGDDLIPAELF